MNTARKPRNQNSRRVKITGNPDLIVLNFQPQPPAAEKKCRVKFVWQDGRIVGVT